MKKSLFPHFCFLTVALATGCHVHISHGWSDADLKSATNVVQTAAIPVGLKELEVDNRFGNVHIIGSDNATNAWTWTMELRAKTDAAVQKLVTNIICKAEVNGDRLSIKVTIPETSVPHSVSSDLEITLPRKMAALVRNRFGGIEVAGLSGDVAATNQNGRLAIRDINGNVRAQTSFDTLIISNTGPALLKDQNGEIRATAIKGSLEASTTFDKLTATDIQGPATLKDQNGRISAANVHGVLKASTSFDSLIAHDVTGEATLHDQNGRIEATKIGGRLEAETSFDSLIARDISGPVRLHNRNGEIKVNHAAGDTDAATSFATLDVEDIQGNVVLKNQNGRLTANGVTGSVNAATSFDTLEVKASGPKLICKNQNGAVRLHATSSALANLEATTSFDSLEVHLSGELKPIIQAKTSFGDIESDFPVTMKPSGQDPFADVGPEVAKVALHNQNGRIRVFRD